MLQAGIAQPIPARRTFDVASIKPSQDTEGGSIARTPGGLTARNAPFNTLIEMAFQTKLLDLSRVPEPLRSEHFDIVAKASGKISGDQYWEMLRSLLEDRFQLRYHRETKDGKIYALVVAKKASGLGPKMNRSVEAECPANPSGSNFCGVAPRPGFMIGQRVPMARIASELSPFAGRPVQDETGLADAFDFQLTWTPDQFRSAGGRVAYLNGNPIDPSGPSFFTAVAEQLGLKLESKQGRIETLVIDHAGSPSEN
jgi:uncharacterized protein (TIGR03435 family)